MKLKILVPEGPWGPRRGCFNYEGDFWLSDTLEKVAHQIEAWTLIPKDRQRIVILHRSRCVAEVTKEQMRETLHFMEVEDGAQLVVYVGERLENVDRRDTDENAEVCTENAEVRTENVEARFDENKRRKTDE